MSAAGHYVLPALIFKRKRIKLDLMPGAPPESVMYVSDNGYRHEKNWPVRNTGRNNMQLQTAGLIGTVYYKGATIDRALKAFQMFGIMPVNTGVFTQVDCAPSTVIDIAINKEAALSAT
ncbi:hypothetical protein PR048_011688 [Dryococelus australis]|uniref:Uncharacterized protein n=1 Tax=Dryococelus australis TaxID=614101 RepID=A0ABQ9HMT1_9NEOP|nr:hypothetical protein PR048_011688 [Dryococelus australis]